MSDLPFGIIVAGLGGLAIGIERQWSGHATGPTARFGGIRTFTLLGIVAGLAGSLWSLGIAALAVVLLASCAALIVAGYVAASHRDVDATTEVGALVVVGAGTLAGLQFLALASALISVTALILLEKSRLHALIARLDDSELTAAVRFSVMAAVVLPVLPAGPYGPWDTIRPRELWILVLFFSGLSFAGFLARRMVGPSHGYPVAGLFGGLISSTNVTLTFARTSRSSPGLSGPLATGALAACTILFARVAIATTVLSPPLALALLPYLLPPFLLGAALLVLSLRRGPRVEAPLTEPANPLQIGAALQMAVLFQIVLIGVAIVTQWWGNVGILVSGAVLGLTDVDALTISMARSAERTVPLSLAAQGVAMGILANTGLKLAVAVVLGSAGFRSRVGIVLAAMAALLGAIIWWW